MTGCCEIAWKIVEAGGAVDHGGLHFLFEARLVEPVSVLRCYVDRSCK